MRDRMERFVLLPFTMGCVSESSIGVGSPNFSRSKDSSTPTRNPQEEEEEEDCEEDQYEQSLSGENLKSPQSLLALPRVHRLFKNLKSFSHFFVIKDDEMEEPEMEMEIGFPTDVKHVTHIGIDGSATSILSKGWDDQKIPESFNLPSLPVMPLQPGRPAKGDHMLDVHGSLLK